MYLTAFNDLSTERQIGMGVGPIPLSKIKTYGRDELGLEGDDDGLDRFCAIIRAMDDEYVSAANSSTTTKTNAEVAADDVDGVRNLMRGLKVRKEAQLKVTKAKP